jgi:hypothetical protein
VGGEKKGEQPQNEYERLQESINGEEEATDQGTEPEVSVQELEENVRLGEVLETVEATGFGFEAEQEEGVVSGRFYQGDYYFSVRSEEEVVEYYIVGGFMYLVTGERCVRTEDTQEEERIPVEAVVNFANASKIQEEYSDVTSTDTTTINEEPVYVFEITPNSEDSEKATLYIGAESGYLRRLESSNYSIDYYTEDSPDPVQPPEMDCEDL